MAEGGEAEGEAAISKLQERVVGWEGKCIENEPYAMHSTPTHSGVLCDDACGGA